MNTLSKNSLENVIQEKQKNPFQINNYQCVKKWGPRGKSGWLGWFGVLCNYQSWARWHMLVNLSISELGVEGS